MSAFQLRPSKAADLQWHLSHSKHSSQPQRSNQPWRSIILLAPLDCCCSAKSLCRPYLLVCQRSMSSLRALIIGELSRTSTAIKGQQSMDSSSSFLPGYAAWKAGVNGWMKMVNYSKMSWRPDAKYSKMARTMSITMSLRVSGRFLQPLDRHITDKVLISRFKGDIVMNGGRDFLSDINIKED